MAEFYPHQQGNNEDELPDSGEKNSPVTVRKISQATDLNTSDWYKVNLGASSINGFLVEKSPVSIEAKINDRSGDIIEVSPGQYYPYKVSKLWVRNAETYPSSSSDEYLRLIFNPSGPGGQTNSLVKTLEEIFKRRYRYAQGDSVNALIVELDTGQLGGSSIVEFWAYINNYDVASTPKITVYGSNTPLEDGDTETGEDGMRFLSRWDYEDELSADNSYVLNSKGYFHLVARDSYRYIYLTVDFGEDGGSDLHGDTEIEITTTR